MAIGIYKVTNIVNNNFYIGSDAEKELKLYKGSVSRVISGECSNTKNYYFISKN